MLNYCINKNVACCWQVSDGHWQYRQGVILNTPHVIDYHQTKLRTNFQYNDQHTHAWPALITLNCGYHIRQVIPEFPDLEVIHFTSHASLWSLWMVISSSVKFLPAGSLSPSPVTPLPKTAPLLSALICPGGGSELSSESARIDIVTSRLLNWTWRKINLLTNALPGYFWWNMLLQNVYVSAWASWELFLVLQVCAKRQKAEESRPWFSQTVAITELAPIKDCLWCMFTFCPLFSISACAGRCCTSSLPRHSGDMWPPRS